VIAPDSSSAPPPRPLSHEVRALLRGAIAGVFRNDPGSAEGLRDALRETAVEARDRGLRPEELIIALKVILDDLPNDIQGLSAVDKAKTRDKVISACISAYFQKG
jgi:hypothetical protein